MGGSLFAFFVCQFFGSQNIGSSLLDAMHSVFFILGGWRVDFLSTTAWCPPFFLSDKTTFRVRACDCPLYLV